MKRLEPEVPLDKHKQNNSQRLVLFDIDQTMISNGGAGRKAIYRALEETLKVDLNQPELAQITMSGKTDPQIIKEFIIAAKLSNMSPPNSNWQQFVDSTLENYLKFLPEEIKSVNKTPNYFMHEGVLKLLEELRNTPNVYLGILTGNIERGARIKLKPFGLDRYFPIGAFGCDSADRLDLPSIAHKRAEKHYQITLEPKQIVIIGDAENDILCAKNYGAISLAVCTGTTTWQELSDLEPTYLFTSLKETTSIIEAIMSEPVSKKLFHGSR